MDSKSYRVNRSTITLRFGDITDSTAEVLVSSDDFLLTMGGGVSLAIARAAGPRLTAERPKMVPSSLGEVVVTSAGDLPAKYIIHAVTIGAHADVPPEAVVRQTTQKAMRLLPLLGCHSIAFPAIGAGFAGISYELVASQMASALVRALLETPDAYQVELFLHDESKAMSNEQLFAFFEDYVARNLGIVASDDEGGVLQPPPEIASPPSTQLEQEARRREQIYVMLQHLDRRRDELETRLVATLQTDAPTRADKLAQIRIEWAQVHEIRRGYETELGQAGERSSPNSVFVSSTALDLKEHREAMRTLIERLQLQFIGMEEFDPTKQLHLTTGNGPL